MEPVVGIICEYDPFHLGHAHQFDLIRRKWPGAAIVCLMSGCFTQRGMPAMLGPRFRAQAALNAGADLVLELPCACAVRDGEHFALGGVEMLTRLGFVTHLCFGAEDGLLTLLPAADLLEEPTEAFQQALRKQLDAGCSFAAAQGRALEQCLGGGAWQKPNNILALCYLRAIRRLHSPLVPYAVDRKSDYHGDVLRPDQWPSATAVRAAFWQGRYGQANAACGYVLPTGPVCAPDALDRLLLYKLRMADVQALALLPDCSEGLEYRLRDCAMAASSREDLLDRLKTRRYARARLSRLCCHALLDITRDFLQNDTAIRQVRLLGLRPGSRVTGLMKQSGIPILARPREDAVQALEKRAYDVWALGAGLPGGLWYTQGVAVARP
ncbi:MAG: nucleotidyltransferase family protein [Clostridiales bacterium]|nr:nucleotidyltransferase family protein [Clostridiales bacterium]